MLERLVARIADAAMDLHRAIGGFADEAVRPIIAHADLVRQRALDLLVRRVVHVPRGLADQQPQHLGLRRELDERELDRLVLRQRLGQRLALASVFAALLDAIDPGAQAYSP